MKYVNIPLNIPNILSLYRLFSFPFVMIFIFTGQQNLFVFFIVFNLITDFLDGWIARRFNQITEIGSILDSLADAGTYILALAGVVVYKWVEFQPYTISLSIFFGLFFIVEIFPLIKFRKFYSYHTYNSKVCAYLKGLFFIVLFAVGFFPWFYWVIIITGVLHFSESIIITIVLKESKSDVKGLYWVLKDSKTKS